VSVTRHGGEPHQLGEGSVVAPAGDLGAESLGCRQERVRERPAPQHVVLGLKLAQPNVKVTTPSRCACAVRGCLNREDGPEYGDENGGTHLDHPGVETSQL
jgi:hypothetical protein